MSIRHLINLILYENDVSICDMFELWDFDYWYLKWLHQEKQWNG